MEIIKLRIKSESSETEVKSLSLIANLGIDGDKKANGGERQLCIADEDALNNYRLKGDGLCVNRFMPNITTRGLDYSKLQPGTQLQVGTAIIQISDYKKKCFCECSIVQSGNTCEICKNSAFAKIITSGTVNV